MTRRGYEGLDPMPEEIVPKKTYMPFGSFIAIHVLKAAEVPGDILLPERGGDVVGVVTGKEVTRALVIACGPECKQVKEGDIVLLAQEVRALVCIHQGHKTNLIREDNIGGIVMDAGYHERRTGFRATKATEEQIQEALKYGKQLGD